MSSTSFPRRSARAIPACCRLAIAAGVLTCLVALAIAGACRGPEPFVIPDIPPSPAVADPFSVALRRGDAAALARLVADQPGEATMALRFAAKHNEVAHARALLAAGAADRAREYGGRTALHLVSSEAMAALLLANGIDARALDDEGRPASRVEDFMPREFARRLVRMLVAAGAPLEPATAVRFLDLDEIRGVLAAGAPSDPCLLHFAAQRGDAQIVDLLLAAGAAREGYCPSLYANVDSWGENALATAVQYGNFAAAASLLAAGLPVRDSGWPDRRHGNTEGGLLQRAAQYGQAGFVARLLDAGAAIEGTGEGDTPLAHAAGRGHTEVVQLLLARGADPRRVSGGASPLRHASIGGHADAADLLVAAGASMTLLDAVGLGRVDDVPQLLAADPRALERPDERLGMRPLLWAAALGRADVAAVLLVAGADVNARSGSRPEIDVADVWWPHGGGIALAPEGISAFGRAVARGDWRIASALVRAGARPNGDEAEALAGNAGIDALALLRQLLALHSLSDEAMLRALAGTLRSALRLAAREQFELLMACGAAPLLRRDDARGLMDGADPALVAPFAGEMRRHGWRPDLPTASRFGWLDEVRALLRAGDFGEHDPDQAWLRAMAGDHPAILRELRSCTKWSVRDTAEHAAFYGAAGVLLDLLGRGELTLAECGPGDLDLLATAAGDWDGDHAVFVRTLLGLGLDPDGAQDGLPLLNACSQSNRAVIATLLAAGARVDLCRGGRTPLSELLRKPPGRDTLEAIRKLLDAGADPVEGAFLANLESWFHYCPPELREQIAALWTECRDRRPRDNARGQ